MHRTWLQTDQRQIKTKNQLLNWIRSFVDHFDSIFQVPTGKFSYTKFVTRSLERSGRISKSVHIRKRSNLILSSQFPKFSGMVTPVRFFVWVAYPSSHHHTHTAPPLHTHTHCHPHPTQGLYFKNPFRAKYLQPSFFTIGCFQRFSKRKLNGLLLLINLWKICHIYIEISDDEWLKLTCLMHSENFGIPNKATQIDPSRQTQI